VPTSILLQQGDITKVAADAIINAANTSLLGGGGVDGAIHRAGGKTILEECVQIRNRQGGCKVGEAVITTAGKLPAQYVIHTVGPRWNNGQSEEEEKLRNCYISVLAIAEEKQLQTIAFPNISTGIYRFPKEKAAQIAIETIQAASLTHVKQVIFVCYDQENYLLYQRLLG
jgi:O-acetyl-ADP-ribose deacetylase (regulator of RNase III)